MPYLILQKKVGTGAITVPVWNTPNQQAKLLASDAASSDTFGHRVSISGDGNTAIVGAPLDDDNGTSSGSAYVFTRSGSVWTQQEKLLASDGAADDQFGYGVDISSDGNTVVVGAQGVSSFAGAAYVFTRSGTTWTEMAKLTASDSAANDQFGWNVAISGDGNTVLSGAYYNSDNGTGSGSAYIFTTSDGIVWGQEAKLLPSVGSSSEYFGRAVDISYDGNTVIIGKDGEAFGGSAYVFTRTGTVWSEEAELTSSDRSASDMFGYAVSISGDGNTVIVGAPRDDDNGSDSGSAYVFTRSGGVWSEQAKLLASDGVANDGFGTAVRISEDGNVLVIGATGTDDNGLSSGSAYMFTKSGNVWSENTKILPNDGATSDNFGSSVSIDSNGNTVIVGSRLDDDNGTSSGSAYIFTP